LKNGISIPKTSVMKKNLPKKKQKRQNAQTKKFSFASYKEDFVITEQEEREGGYFGKHNFQYNYYIS
jgi:hypothetical protein